MVLSKDGKGIQTMTKKQAIKRAEQLDKMLKNLQSKVGELVIHMSKEYMDMYPHMVDLFNTLQDLENFDLEDSIISAKEFEY